MSLHLSTYCEHGFMFIETLNTQKDPFITQRSLNLSESKKLTTEKCQCQVTLQS